MPFYFVTKIYLEVSLMELQSTSQTSKMRHETLSSVFFLVKFQG